MVSISDQEILNESFQCVEINPVEKICQKSLKADFMRIFPKLLKDLTEFPDYSDMPEINEWFKSVLEYNATGGKHSRGLATATAYRAFCPNATEADINLSYVLGWCAEILQAFCLMADDIMDDSTTRRGKLCWYTKHNLGVLGFNDALLLEQAAYLLLDLYFADKDYYQRLLVMSHEVSMKTVLGQSLDIKTSLETDFNRFNMTRYNSIVKYKTSYYTFYFPVILGMTMAGIEKPEMVQEIKDVALRIGHYFQVQDDYLDCYGDPKVTGKIGTDIQDGKCSWLFITAKEVCDKDQKKFLFDNYGRKEEKCVQIVKSIYNEVDLIDLYEEYEDTAYKYICDMVDKMTDKKLKGMFRVMMNEMYRRVV